MEILENLIRENPRYTKMTPEKILGKFVSRRMMVKEARYVDDALNGPLPVYEPQLVALKATSSRETLPSKVAQVEAAGLNEDEMALMKGKCALGPFLSILVIECQLKCLKCEFMQWMNKVHIKSKGMFLSLSTLVLCTNILV
jgi:hypothetical protein